MLSFDFEVKLGQGKQQFHSNYCGNIPDKSIIGLKGPSASGKTTLLRHLCGLDIPISGVILSDIEVLFSKKPYKNVPPGKRKISLVFQDYALFSHLTVNQNVNFGTRDKTWAEYCLALTGLCGSWNKTPAKLSGGQKQRLAIARALACKPEFLFLDEPFNSLDDELRVELRSQLTEIFRSLSLTVVLVSHSCEDLTVCDQILSIKDFQKQTLPGSRQELSTANHARIAIPQGLIEAECPDVGYVS